MSRLYYLQDKRQHVGNCIMWWRRGHAGYTTNLLDAHVFTEEEAMKQHRSRKTDVPWPKSYIDSRARPTVDMQRVDRAQAGPSPEPEEAADA